MIDAIFYVIGHAKPHAGQLATDIAEKRENFAIGVLRFLPSASGFRRRFHFCYKCSTCAYGPLGGAVLVSDLH